MDYADRIMIGFVLMLGAAVLTFASYALWVAAGDKWVIEDEVIETVDDGRKLKHQHRRDPYLGIIVERNHTEIVPAE